MPRICVLILYVCVCGGGGGGRIQAESQRREGQGCTRRKGVHTGILCVAVCSVATRARAFPGAYLASCIIILFFILGIYPPPTRTITKRAKTGEKEGRCVSRAACTKNNFRLVGSARWGGWRLRSMSTRKSQRVPKYSATQPALSVEPYLRARATTSCAASPALRPEARAAAAR